MRKLVGERDGVSSRRREISATIRKFFRIAGPFYPFVRKFSCKCEKCGNEIKITFSENIPTGEIWIEGPDFCDKCGNRLSAKNLSGKQLSQKGIVALFGE